jgi:lipopolysaccharide export system permease protein
MKLLSRYVARQFFGTFVMLVLGLPLLFIITDITDQLDKYLAKGLTMRAVALSYLYQLPQFIMWAFPIAALVATVFTIGNMTRYQEIVAAKAGGVSFYRLVRPLLGFGVVLSVAALALGELVPVTNQRRNKVLGERQASASTMRTNFVFQTGEGRTLSVRRLDPASREMQDVVLERDITDKLPGVHQTAQKAVWEPGKGWLFHTGYVRLLDEKRGESSFTYSYMRIPGLTETPEELLAEPKEPEEMRYQDMTRFIRAIQRSGGDTRELEVERAQKISLPLAVMVIILFGAPLATSSQRGGAAYGIGISLAVTMIYLMLFRVGTAIGASGALPPVAAAWLPNGIFLLGALVLLWRVRT